MPQSRRAARAMTRDPQRRRPNCRRATVLRRPHPAGAATQCVWQSHRRLPASFATITGLAQRDVNAMVINAGVVTTKSEYARNKASGRKLQCRRSAESGNNCALSVPMLRFSAPWGLLHGHGRASDSPPSGPGRGRRKTAHQMPVQFVRFRANMMISTTLTATATRARAHVLSERHHVAPMPNTCRFRRQCSIAAKMWMPNSDDLMHSHSAGHICVFVARLGTSTIGIPINEDPRQTNRIQRKFPRDGPRLGEIQDTLPQRCI